MRSSPDRRPLAALWLLVVLSVASGCGRQTVTPVTPTPVLVTDNFTGTLAVLGSDSKRFTVNHPVAGSDASITVTSLTTVANGSPLSTTISVAFGLPAVDGSCAANAALTAPTAGLNQELIGRSVFEDGEYCVKISDIGTLTEPANYAFTVRHF